MPIRLFRIAVAMAVVIFLTVIYRAVNNTAVTGSGGLGASSFGFGELLLECAALALVAGLYFYLRSQRGKLRRPGPPG